MRLLKILPLVTFLGAVAFAAEPAAAGRIIIDGGATINVSGYCSPAAATSGGCVPTALPFAAQIGAETYNSVYVNSNGTLSFGSIAPQLALQNNFTDDDGVPINYAGPAPLTSLGGYPAPILSPNFVDGPGYGVINFSGPSPGFDGVFASTQTLTGNSLTVNFFTCTTTVTCGTVTINAIANASSGSGLYDYIVDNYSPDPFDPSAENFEQGRAAALAALGASLEIYTVTLTGLSDGFTVAYTYSPAALGDTGTFGFNFPSGLNETTGPLTNNSVRFTNSAVTAAVPEPTSWMMMLLGFAAIGAALRRRKAGAKLAAA